MKPFTPGKVSSSTSPRSLLACSLPLALSRPSSTFHHHHQAHEARQLILAETALNRQHIVSQLSIVESHERWLMQDLATIEHLRAHKLLPNDPFRYLRWADKFSTSAWVTAQTSGITNYLPRKEVIAWEASYRTENQIDEYSVAAKANLVRAISVLNSADGPQHLTGAQFLAQEKVATSDRESQTGNMENLTPADLLRLSSTQLDELERGVQLAISQDHQLIRWFVDLGTLMDELPRS